MTTPNSEIDIEALQQTLVDKLVEKELLLSDEVIAAFRAVPRHLFLPNENLLDVYKDRPIVTKRKNGRAVSSSSQPTMMAIMLEQLAAHAGENVLEVGAGTGYNAALLGQIVGKNGRVTTIDIDPETAAAAQHHLQVAEANNVQVICGDGALGYADNAPYDCLILTVGGWDITPEWLAQLKPNGRIVLPLSFNGPQLSVKFVRENGHLISQSIRACGFMRLQGPHAEPEYEIELGEEGTIRLSSRVNDFLNAPVLVNNAYAWLMTEPIDLDTAVTVTMQDIWRSLSLWLALHEPNCCFLEDVDVQETTPVPHLYNGQINEQKWVTSIGLYLPDGMAFLMHPHPPQPEEDSKPVPFSLHIRGFGLRDTAVSRLHNHILQWDQAGRLNAENLNITGRLLSNNHHSAENGLIVKKKWHQFILQWQAE